MGDDSMTNGQRNRRDILDRDEPGRLSEPKETVGIVRRVFVFGRVIVERVSVTPAGPSLTVLNGYHDVSFRYPFAKIPVFITRLLWGIYIRFIWGSCNNKESRYNWFYRMELVF